LDLMKGNVAPSKFGEHHPFEKTFQPARAGL
jgi:hypothetical protein